jgi:lysyl-tRNA synthetase class 2
MLAAARRHFAATGALEVETPSLSRAAVSDVNLASVAATVCGQQHYLQTSPEYFMKRLLIRHRRDLWQTARVYRDGEAGRCHNPEFTLIEWYRLGIDHHALMHEVEILIGGLLASAAPPLQDLTPAEHLTYQAAFERFAGLDPFAADTACFVARLRDAHIDVPAGIEADRDACLDLLMSTLIGPRLGDGRITFIYDYPASQSALARVRGRVASRFEAYLHGLELANGFHELGDAAEQRQRFEQDLAERRRRGLPTAPLDEDFLAALQEGLPDCSGVALGFDRLVMCAAQATHIREVLTFGFDD